MATKDVQTLVDDIYHLGHEQHSMVEGVRKLVKAVVSPLSEEVKYGGILFTSDVQFCGVFAYRSMFQWSLTKAPKSRMSSGISKVAGKAVGT